MGMAHGLETLLDAAAQLQRQNSNAHFLLVGEGAEKERIKDAGQIPQTCQRQLARPATSRKNPGFHLRFRCLSGSAEEDRCLQDSHSHQDARVHVLRPPLILGVEGQAQQIIEDAGAGLVIEPENADALANAISQLSANRELGEELGRKGREYILQNFSRGRTAEKYIDVLQRFLRKRQAG